MREFQGMTNSRNFQKILLNERQRHSVQRHSVQRATYPVYYKPSVCRDKYDALALVH